MPFPIDDETLKLMELSKNILKRQIKIVGILLENVSNKRNEKLSTVAINVLAVGGETIALEIIENMIRGHIVISVIALRSLFENYVNIHYIFHHPKHLNDVNWACNLCDDFIKRSYEGNFMKNKLGEKSLKQRAEEVYFKKFYEKIYIELSNSAHSLMSMIDHGDNYLLKQTRIKVCIYTLMFLQDSISAIISFFQPEVDIDDISIINEIIEIRKYGESILQSMVENRCS